MKKIIILILSIIFIFTLCCCNGTATKEVTEPKEITKSQNGNLNLKTEVTCLDSEPLELNGVGVKIIGASFDKATGDILNDSVMGGGLANEDFTSGTDRGFAIGFKNSDEEIKKMDAYLSLYLEFSFDEDVTSRDSVKPEMDMKITDNQNEELAFIFNSLDDDYINIDNPYAVVIYKAYYDSTDFNLNINGTEYHLEADILKKQ